MELDAETTAAIVAAVSSALYALVQYAAYIGKPKWVIGLKAVSWAWDKLSGNHSKAENN